jgi:uncharacterized protein (TIGR00730 family)
MRRICVFMGSNPGERNEYAALAREMGEELADRKLGLVYGGASVGLMAAVADALLERGGEVVGVIPRQLVDKEIAHTGLTEQHVVGSMHERKLLMAEKSDAFAALPGGFGTMDEIFEMLTWSQLGFHEKPCGLVNAMGYYDMLRSQLEHMVAEGFLKAEFRDMLLSAKTPGELLDQFATYEPPRTGKWIHRPNGL